MAAAFKAQMEPGSDLPKLLGGRGFLWGQNVSRPSGQHLGVLALAPILQQARSCSPCQL